MQSQRASSTFCWLPPESSRIFCSTLEALIARRFMKRSTIARWRASSTTPIFVRRGKMPSVMFSRTDMSGTIPSALRSSLQ